MVFRRRLAAPLPKGIDPCLFKFRCFLQVGRQEIAHGRKANTGGSHDENLNSSQQGVKFLVFLFKIILTIKHLRSPSGKNMSIPAGENMSRTLMPE